MKNPECKSADGLAPASSVTDSSRHIVQMARECLPNQPLYAVNASAGPMLNRSAEVSVRYVDSSLSSYWSQSARDENQTLSFQL